MRNRRSFFGAIAALVAAVACRPGVAHETLSWSRGTLTLLPQGWEIGREEWTDLGTRSTRLNIVENGDLVTVTYKVENLSLDETKRLMKAIQRPNDRRIGKYRPGTLIFLGATGEIIRGLPTKLRCDYRKPC